MKLYRSFFFCLTIISFDAFSQNTSSVEDEKYALKMDLEDPLKEVRNSFFIPKHEDKELIYLNGNSLGLQAKKTKEYMNKELDAWAHHGIEGHFKNDDPWYTYNQMFKNSLSKIVGAHADEIVVMNSLTVNLHLMLTSFYRPSKSRYKILMEEPVFSSDTYAVKSQLKLHGLNPEKDLVIAAPSVGSKVITLKNIEDVLDNNKGEVSLILLSGVNFLSGQSIDIAAISKLAQKHGAVIGIDLAHAIGNVPLKLHDWNVDFAVWCSYKYLNAGPGATGGAFVHEKHLKNKDLHRLAGWFGNDPEKRFQIQLQKEFVPMETAESWQVSNHPIFSMVPLKASLEIYDQVGMEAYRQKSLRLTGYLENLIQKLKIDEIEIITPKNPEERGCQLSLEIKNNSSELHSYLTQKGIVSDFRKPNVIRVAPVPFYNKYHDVWKFAEVVKEFYLLKKNNS